MARNTKKDKVVFTDGSEIGHNNIGNKIVKIIPVIV